MSRLDTICITISNYCGLTMDILTSRKVQQNSLDDLAPGFLYAVLSYRGDLASWNWEFFVPDPAKMPIGHGGTVFGVVDTADSGGQWMFEFEYKDIISSPLVVAIVQLTDVAELGSYAEVVGDSGLLPMFKEVAVPLSPDPNKPPAEFSSRSWFLEAICVLHDCGVVTCDDVWLLEREVRRYAFAGMDKYLQTQSR